jgi:RluA family pseudouridine synthase
MSAVEALISNAAAYKFVQLNELPTLRQKLRLLTRELGLRGTILLSSEGINLFIAGAPPAVEQFLAELKRAPGLEDLEVKLSPSDYQPFTRMLVRLKKEIIALGQPEIQPERYTSRKISAPELKAALDRGEDLLLLDVRNDYEVELGTFNSAVPIGLDHFRDFPQVAANLPADWRQRRIVMFCTGGIRCEKAGPVMERLGFADILQLEGGILKYFEEVGAAHYRGDCFVFDKRVAVNPELDETSAGLCYACQAVLSESDQQSPLYIPGKQCPHCFQTPEQKLAETIERRQAELQQLTTPLPGKGPYDSVRPLNVPAKYDQLPLLEMLGQWHDHLPAGYWAKECELGRIHCDGIALSAQAIVRSGMRLEHHLPGTSEPDVSREVEWIYEDEYLVILNKPAPLPVHPCGRFNRNSLTAWLNLMYGQQKLRPAHRLDANTTGLIVFSRTKEIARQVQPQFEAGTVVKTYLALVEGEVHQSEFACTAPIGSSPISSGGRTVDWDEGQPARTEFRRIQSGRQSLLECRPLSGRTNQIRVHLHTLGYPIVGDPVYGRVNLSTEIEPTATRTVDSVPMCLHAWKLSFVHPHSGEWVSFEAPAPAWAK